MGSISATAERSARLAVGIASGAQDKRQLEHGQELVGLAIREIHFGFGFEAETLGDVADYADDFH